jgi:hypothetical protein
MDRVISDEFMQEVCQTWGYEWDTKRQRVIDPATGKDAFQTYQIHGSGRRPNYVYSEEGLTEEQIKKKRRNRDYFKLWYYKNKETLKLKRQEKKNALRQPQ